MANDIIETKFKNIDLEYQVVAYVFENPKSSIHVKSEWFTVHTLSRVLSLFKESKAAITKPTLLYLLQKKKILTKENSKQYKETITKIEETENPFTDSSSFLVSLDQLRDLASSRNILLGLKDIISSVKEFDLPKAISKLRDISKVDISSVSDKTGDWLEDFDSRVEVVSNRAKAVDEEGKQNIGVPTGIQRLDSIIGGLVPGEWGVVVGRPGIGKTATLVSFAANGYVAGYNVLFATGEMPKLDIEFRIDANLAGVSAASFRTGKLNNNQWNKWKNTIGRFRDTTSNYLEVCSFPRNFNAADLENQMRRVQDERGQPIHLICIDYLNIMNSVNSGRGSNKDWESQSDAVWDVKGLVAEFNGGIAAWSAGQITDEGFELDQLELKHVKYARAISETAPIVVGLVQTVDDELENRIQLQILKMRNAERLERPIYLHPNLDLMRLHESVLMRKSLLCLEKEVGEKKQPKPRRKKNYERE
jgi:replicative DNA helicase